MEEHSLLFHIGPVWFDGTILLMTVLTCVIVFTVVFAFSRNLQMKPKGKQNALEYVLDFVRNIVSSQLPSDEVSNYHFLAFTLFMFILVANELGLVSKIVTADDTTLWKSPTADPIVTLSLAFMVMLLTHFFGSQKFGLKGYFKNAFMEPIPFILPIKVLEDFTNIISLGLRLYGNIYAGEVLVGLIVRMVNGLGWLALPVAWVLEMVWAGFSLFIGGIQAYVFTTLTMVFLSHKVVKE